jgi:hypothetical protein
MVASAASARKKKRGVPERGDDEDVGSDSSLDAALLDDDVDQEPVPRLPATTKTIRQRKGRTKKAGTNSSSSSQAEESDPMYWTVDTDAPVVVRSQSGGGEGSEGTQTSLVRFVVRGQPRPLVRHRVSTFRMYNPSAAAQAAFRSAVRELLLRPRAPESVPPTPPEGRLQLYPADAVNGIAGGKKADESSSPSPPFEVMFPTQSLAVSVAFRMRRPLNHFEACKRRTHPLPQESDGPPARGGGGGAGGRPRLRRSAPPQTLVTRSDVDNLAKFVLDSLNGLLYDDDRQVCSLHATRLLDNDGLCLGSTEVCVRAVGDADLPRLLNGSFHPP